MKYLMRFSIGFVVVGVSLALWVWFQPKSGEVTLCTPLQIALSAEAEVGFEFLDFRQRQVWATTDFTVDEFDAFRFPWAWRLLWQKNQPRVGLADGGRFLKSPGCEHEGEYTQSRMFERDFLKVVHLIRLAEPLDDDGLVRSTRLEKYHVVQFNAGNTITVLNGPDASQYVLLTRDAQRTTDNPTLPDDWTISSYDVIADLELSLSGEVSNIWLDNSDSYQGPLPADLDRTQYLVPVEG